MSRKKKNRNQETATKLILLITALKLIALITAILFQSTPSVGRTTG